MNSYSGFAEVYDIFMDNVPYGKWCERITDRLTKYGIGPADQEEMCRLSGTERNLYEERHTILDLGCGTGKLTRMLSEKGYSMIGIDLSPEMLQIAREAEMERAAGGLENAILYLEQDMRELELFGTVGAVISVCDSINYLLEENDLVETFKRVNNYLYPGGLFVFDFNTVHKYRDVIGDTVIAENREDCSFIWENTYFADRQINQYDLTLFVRDEGEYPDEPDEGEYPDEQDGEIGSDDEEEAGQQAEPFLRLKETHYQRGYTLEQIRECLQKAGMIFLEAIDADTEEAVTQQSERILVLAKEHGNCQKVIENGSSES